MIVIARSVAFEDAYDENDFESPEEYQDALEEYGGEIVGVDVEADGKSFRLLDKSEGSRMLLYLDDTYSDALREDITDEVIETVVKLVEETVLFGDVDKIGYLQSDSLTDIPVVSICDADDYDWHDTMTIENVWAQYGIYEGIDGILYDESGCPLPDQWD